MSVEKGCGSLACGPNDALQDVLTTLTNSRYVKIEKFSSYILQA